MADNEELLPCGHTEAEHKAQAQDIMERVSQGDLTPLIATMPSEMLAQLAQAVATEIVIRAEDMDMARRIWDTHDKLVRGVLLAADQNASEEPAVYEAVQKARAEYHAELRSREFMAQAEDELRIILEQQGVVEDPLPPPPWTGEPKDQWPGQYL
jgi:hypothetical protein